MKKIFLIIPIVVSISLLAIPYVVYSDNFVMYQNSDSMYPAIMPDDLLIIEKSEITSVQVDDLIAFETHAEGVEVLVRRVIEVGPDHSGKFGVDTQGDHEALPDNWTVYSGEYVGKVSEINPSAGFMLSEYFQYPLVIVIVISASILVRESIPKRGMELEQLTCLRCGYKWHPRIINGKAKIPATCPEKKCRSPSWNKPRQKES